MDDQKIISAYSFLAALTETNNDLFKGVFVPITKRALSFYSINQSSSGTDQDIQETINQLYGLNVPLTIVRRLIKAVEKDLSRREKRATEFNVMENGKSFQLTDYTFTDIEDKYQEGKRNASALNKAFILFIEKEGSDIESIPAFATFLQKNQTKLSGFFNGKADKLIDNKQFSNTTFIHHVHFLEHIERSHHTLYKIAESIYLGSIVASFLESDFDFDAKPNESVTYYLDTQIILEALDLQHEAATKPIQELFSLISDTGGKLRILDITIDEITYHLQIAINNFNNKQATTTINEACLRNGKTKTSLINLSGKLANVLNEKFGIKREIIPPSLIEKFLKSADLSDLKKERNKEANARHDVFAYLYVREQRSKKVNVHNKANFWFVSANRTLLRFNVSRLDSSEVSEITLPDSLTALLWIRNPQKYLKKLKSIGLNELMSVTLQEEIVTREMINEFDKNLQENESISQEDYLILIASMAHQSAKYIEHLNEIAEKDKEKFNVEAIKLVEKERRRREETKEIIRGTKEKEKQNNEANRELHLKLSAIETETQNRQFESDALVNKLQTDLSKQSKHIRLLVILIFLLLSFVLYLLLMNGIIDIKYLNEILYGIAGFGGLWSFLSLMLNLIKSIKRS